MHPLTPSVFIRAVGDREGTGRERGTRGKLTGTYIRILPNHLGHLRRNLFTFLAPRRRAFEDGDAFVHDCFEVLGFGVEDGDVLGG